MQTQTSINWSQAQQQATINETKKADRLQDFLEESHELTDARDLQYWIDETGADLFFLLQNAPDLAPNIKEPLLNGATLDDIWNVVPSFPYEEDEEQCEDFNSYFGHLFNN